MPGQGRLGDKAQVPLDAHGCPACPHPGVGPAIQGSPDVQVNKRPAVRVGDPGLHAACCGPNTWTAQRGSTGVFINGKAAFRMGDPSKHCGGMGQLIEGSPNVVVGEVGGGPPTMTAVSSASTSAASAAAPAAAASGGSGTAGAAAGPGGAGASGGGASGGGASGAPARDHSLIPGERASAASATPAPASSSVSSRPASAPRTSSARAAESPASAAPPRDAPAPRPPPVEQPPPPWLEAVMLGADGKPLAGERYLITDASGRQHTGSLDASGTIRLTDIPAGTCTIAFPDLDSEAWEPA